MTIDLSGQILASVTSDSALEIVTVEGWHVTVENHYLLRGDDGSVLSTAAGEEDRIVAVLRAAIGTALISFAHTEDGHLRFGVAAGEVHVAPSPDVESWNVVGPDRERVVAMPGGTLATWS